MTRDDALLVHDILEAIGSIQEYTAGMSRAEFVSNKLVLDAVMRNFEIVGEAAGRIDRETQNEHAGIDWADITGTDPANHGGYGRA